MPERLAGTTLAPGAAWQRWMVRAVLAAAIVWAVLPVGQLFATSQWVWAITGTIATLGLAWALISSGRRRLRRTSWMPVVCLLLVVGMVTVVAGDPAWPLG